MWSSDLVTSCNSDEQLAVPYSGCLTSGPRESTSNCLPIATCTMISAANTPASEIQTIHDNVGSMPPVRLGFDTHAIRRYSASIPAHAPKAPSPAKRAILGGMR